jgi:membrane protease YdiL (CAAX protease family)
VLCELRVSHLVGPAPALPCSLPQSCAPDRPVLTQHTTPRPRSLLATWRLSLTRPVLLLLAFHAAQLAVLVSPLVLGASRAFPPYDAASACFTSGALWWGVAWEELVYRVMLFYIVLQRSGGQVRVASFVSAAVFGAVHLSNAAQAATPRAIVALQALTAIMFGGAYSAIFASTGSVGATVAVHAANNLVALVWVAVDPTPAADGAPAAACTSRYSATLAASLAVQGAAYLAAAALANVDLGDALTADASGSSAFRAMHPLPYGAQPLVPAASGDKRKAD